jgi:hypothetical protein
VPANSLYTINLTRDQYAHFVASKFFSLLNAKGKITKTPKFENQIRVLYHNVYSTTTPDDAYFITPKDMSEASALERYIRENFEEYSAKPTFDYSVSDAKANAWAKAQMNGISRSDFETQYQKQLDDMTNSKNDSGGDVTDLIQTLSYGGDLDLGTRLTGREYTTQGENPVYRTPYIPFIQSQLFAQLKKNGIISPEPVKHDMFGNKVDPNYKPNRVVISFGTQNLNGYVVDCPDFNTYIQVRNALIALGAESRGQRAVEGDAQSTSNIVKARDDALKKTQQALKIIDLEGQKLINQAKKIKTMRISLRQKRSMVDQLTGKAEALNQERTDLLAQVQSGQQALLQEGASSEQALVQEAGQKSGGGGSDGSFFGTFGDIVSSIF